MTREAVKAKYNKQPQSWLIPIGEIPVSKRAEVESRLQNLGGIVVNETMRRRYAEPGLAGPVLGLVGEYGPMDEQSLAGKGYRDGDWIGRTGVEQAVELDVAGVRGGSLGLVAPDGGWVRLLSQQPRRDGKDVLLTLDRELQRAAEEAMTGETLRGAVVVLEIASRQVLAAVSRPGYDPGAVAADIHDQRWRWGVMDSSSQFANRTAALYPLTQVTTVLSAGTAELARALGLGGPESAIGLPPLPADQRPGSGVAASPLQLAALMAALAGDGRLRMPVLAQEVCDADGTVEKTLLPKDSGPLPLLPAQTEALRREVARLSPKTNVTAGPSEDAYAEAGPDGPVLPATPAWGPVWYAGYAPAEQPRYVVVGLAEYGQQDGLTVASAVQALLQRLGG